MNSGKPGDRPRVGRLLTMVAAVVALASVVAGCIVVPVGGPRYYHPYYWR